MVGKGHVLIGGGTGFIGTALKYLLTSVGYNVSLVSRMPKPNSVTWLDLSQKGLPEGITAVVNLAGQNVLDPTQRWTPGFKQNVWNSRINTTKTLATAIQRSDRPPPVFLTISGVGIYEPSETAEYDEKSDVSRSFDFLSELALEWEAASRLPADLPVRVANIRPGVVLGRGGGMIKQLYWPFFLGVGGPIASGKQFMPWIHIKDLCNMFLMALENSQATGPINGVAPQVVTNEEFTKAFASAMARPAVFRVPEFVLDTMFSQERAKMMTKGQRVKPTEALRLGFTYEYPTIDKAVKDCSRLLYSPSTPL